MYLTNMLSVRYKCITAFCFFTIHELILHTFAKIHIQYNSTYKIFVKRLCGKIKLEKTGNVKKG